MNTENHNDKKNTAEIQKSTTRIKLERTNLRKAFTFPL